MSYNGSGTFLINTSGQPVVTGTPISSTVFNALTADLATGLSTAITKDGQTATTARIPFAQGISSTLVTDSTSTTTGSIITAGGAGVAKALFVGTTANVAGAVTLQSTLGVTGITTFSAQPIFSSLTASSAVATDASKGLVSVTNTGTGNNVLATSPTLVTPILGVATATSINKVALTAPATSATLTIANGASLVTSGAYSLTLTATAATNVTLPTSGTVLSTATAGVPVNGPAFSAYATSSQSISSATFTKITFDTEVFDTNSNFASSRFTPTVAGYYQVSGNMRCGGTLKNISVVVIYKNGSSYGYGNQINGTSAIQLVVSEVVYLDGSTDYVELYGYVDATTPTFENASTAANCRFSAALVRSAV